MRDGKLDGFDPRKICVIKQMLKPRAGFERLAQHVRQSFKHRINCADMRQTQSGTPFFKRSPQVRIHHCEKDKPRMLRYL
jgi:hypothetical protein